MVQSDADQEALRERLRRARWRMRTAARGGPEWDAAMAEIEELEARLFTLRPDDQRQRILVEFEDGPCAGQRDDLTDLPGTTRHPDSIAVPGGTYRLRRLLGGIGYYGLWRIERPNRDSERRVLDH